MGIESGAIILWMVLLRLSRLPAPVYTPLTLGSGKMAFIF